MDNIIYKWMQKPIEMTPNIPIPQFSIVSDKSDCSEYLSSGKYPQDYKIRIASPGLRDC